MYYIYIDDIDRDQRWINVDIYSAYIIYHTCNMVDLSYYVRIMGDFETRFPSLVVADRGSH